MTTLSRFLLVPAALAALCLACSDQPAAAVDAAGPVCDCPAAEPPLTGRIVVEHKQGAPVAAERSVSSGSCASPDEVLLAGRVPRQPIRRPRERPGHAHRYEPRRQWRVDMRTSTTTAAKAVDIIFDLTCLKPSA